MKNTSKIAVIGGTGKSGKYVVRELIERGYNFKILVRNPESFKIESPLIRIVHGNVTDFQTVKSLIQGCDALISTMGIGIPNSEPTIFSTATQNILRAMDELALRRYIVITGLNVDTTYDNKGPKAKIGTKWMYANYPKSTHDRQLEYNLLTESRLDWTLIRLPLIKLTDESRKIKISLEDCLGDEISATDLAHFLVTQLNDRTFVRKAPFFANV